MSQTHDFLVELGTEELPPKALLKLRDAFAQGIADGLSKAGLSYGKLTAYATPRRLAAWVTQLPSAQADQQIERRGPALKAAYDDTGNPTKTALGFAASCGVDVTQLQKLETDKGAWLVHRAHQAGQPTPQLLPGIVSQSLAALPIPKRMRWGANAHEFVRPAHWLVMLWDNQIIEANLLGVHASNQTRGHRFHRPDAIAIRHPSSYAEQLRQEGHVWVDFAGRRGEIERQVKALAAELSGHAVMESALLDEVTALVEWPRALAGSFDAQFLEVPAEALISTMQEHQRYFAVRDAQGQLMPNFITVANIESKDITQVRTGNERVIRPRFTDAQFFWRQDRKAPLAQRLDTLTTIVFQNKIGTIHDKVTRVAALAHWIAGEIGADPAQAERAAQLAKCDLVTHMVNEFPELQGIMGRYCAHADGEPATVADAVEQHYWPRFAGDNLPTSSVAQSVALADRLDTLMGIFAIGQTPTGDKDPFGLRRAAIGVLRILIECQLPLSLKACLQQAATGFPAALQANAALDTTHDFIAERLRAYYTDQSIRVDLFEAVRAVNPAQPLDFDRRLRACNAFLQRAEAPSLAAANKRVGNILKKLDTPPTGQLNDTLLSDPAEKALAASVIQLQQSTAAARAASDYTQILSLLAQLKEPVDAFFAGVMVMADDPHIRNNRLLLLQSMRELFLAVADFSHVQS
jgi:glycyl-tRNA synthetase beta chain